MTQTIVIIGDGAMATVCALILTEKGFPARLWSYSAEQAAALAAQRENHRFLPGFKLPATLEITAEDQTVFSHTDWVISAIPCKYLRSVWQRLAAYLPKGLPILSVTKGIEHETLARPTEIIGQITGPRPLAVLSGPNIAEELARKLPATSTVASEDQTLAREIQQAFSTPWLRIYTHNDLLGVELAGATKNVIAIAAGIIDGLGGGHNVKAALLTRGLVEISRLGIAMGARQETFAGLSGMGDLITTCYSPRGRNRTFGETVGRGRSVEHALAAIPGEVEGVNTVRSLIELARRHQVEMPIAEAVYQIVFEHKPVATAVHDLMTRRLKAENGL